MQKISIREIGSGLFFAAVVAALYRYWLTYPILKKLSYGEWLAVAVLVAATLGMGSVFARMPISIILLASAAGVVLGGAWAGLSAPHDIPTDFLAEAESHLRIFWREVVLLFAATAIGSFACAWRRKNSAPRVD